MSNIVGIIHNGNSFYDRSDCEVKEIPIPVSNYFGVGIIVSTKQNVVKIKSCDFMDMVIIDTDVNEIISKNAEDIKEIVSFEKLFNICQMRKNFLIKAQDLLLQIYELVDRDINLNSKYTYLNNNDFLNITHENIRIHKKAFVNLTEFNFNGENQIRDFIYKTAYAPHVYYDIIDLLKLANIVDNEILKEKINELRIILQTMTKGE